MLRSRDYTKLISRLAILMDHRDRALALLQRLYAAPGSIEGWQAFLDALCATVDGCGANFISHDLRTHRAHVAATARTDPAALEAYNTHWGAWDPWARSPRLSGLPPASVVIGDELVPHAQFRRTEYYGEFARQYDIVRCIAGMIETGPDVLSVISVNGTERRGPFGSEEAALMSVLVPHVHRALQLHRRLARVESERDDLAWFVERASHAVLFVNRAGRVTYMNSVAERLSAARDGFVVDEQGLRASRPSDTDRLRRLLADAAATTIGEGVSSGGVLALGRCSGRPLVAIVSPLARRQVALAEWGMPVAVVMITDSDRHDIADAETLRMLYGLTPAEATLARLLAEGIRLEEAGARLGLQTATVRTRLKAIFAKTNTHRQSELVRTVLTAAPRL